MNIQPYFEFNIDNQRVVDAFAQGSQQRDLKNYQLTILAASCLAISAAVFVGASIVAASSLVIGGSAIAVGLSLYSLDTVLENSFYSKKWCELNECVKESDWLSAAKIIKLLFPMGQSSFITDDHPAQLQCGELKDDHQNLSSTMIKNVIFTAVSLNAALACDSVSQSEKYLDMLRDRGVIDINITQIREKINEKKYEELNLFFDGLKIS